MLLSSVMTSNQKSWLPILLAIALVSACASPFAFQVQSSSPSEVGSVFVLFGNQADFQNKERSADIIKLIQPSKLKSYVSYSEYELDYTDGKVVWTRLSEKPDPKITIETDPDQPGVLSCELDRELLDLYDELGIAIIVGTTTNASTPNAYHLKSWKHTYLAEAEGILVINVTGSDITGTLR